MIWVLSYVSFRFAVHNDSRNNFGNSSTYFSKERIPASWKGWYTTYASPSKNIISQLKDIRSCIFGAARKWAWTYFRHRDKVHKLLNLRQIPRLLLLQNQYSVKPIYPKFDHFHWKGILLGNWQRWRSDIIFFMIWHSSFVHRYWKNRLQTTCFCGY